MSVQNGERLVTKQDLADMYQGILPYLGGMPEVVANKFSKGDLYSTDEKMIGQWVDGKPLYKITYVATFSDKSVGQRFYIKLADMSNVEYVSANGMIKFNETGEIYSVCTYATDKFQGVSDSNSAYSVWNADGSSHGVVVKQNFVNGNASGTVKVTILYIKTTDTAISIGSETDYSTTEKIVGTWIDGKPVYQRTFQCLMPTVTTDGVDATGERINIGADVERFININGIVAKDNSYYYLPDVRLMNASQPQSGTYISRFALNNYTTPDSSARNTFAIKSNYMALNGINAYVTVQYTKAT